MYWPPESLHSIDTREVMLSCSTTGLPIQTPCCARGSCSMRTYQVGLGGEALGSPSGGRSRPGCDFGAVSRVPQPRRARGRAGAASSVSDRLPLPGASAGE